MSGLLLSRLEADLIASRLDIDVDAVGICHACLSFVSFAIDDGDQREINRQTRAFAPILWSEGLALPTRLALERALRRGDPDIHRAIWDVDMNHGEGRIAYAVVQRLAAQLLERSGLRAG